MLFVLVKHGAPLVVRLQVDEILGVAESPGVSSIVGKAHLGDDRFHLLERREYCSAAIAEFLAFRKTRAVAQSAARPDRSFIEMRQEFGADDAAKAQIDCPPARD